MKKLLRDILLWTLILYGLSAFITLVLNPLEWHEKFRVGAALIWAVLILPINLAFYYDAKMVDVCVEVKNENDKALLVADKDIRVWLPKNQIQYDKDFQLDTTTTITLKVDLARKKGLI